MSTLAEFVKACPVGFELSDLPRPEQSYKYFVSGKNCTLGVLFEDTINVYYEWLSENDMPVTYPPSIRYKWFNKREFTRLIRLGVWEVSCQGSLV